MSNDRDTLALEVTEFEARWNGLIDRLRTTDGIDQRNVAIAATEAENAFFRVQRAIATPMRLVLNGPVPTDREATA